MEGNKARLTLRIKAILKHIGKTEPQTELYYADASLQEGTGVTVAVDRSHALVTAGTELDLNATTNMETNAITCYRALLPFCARHRYSLHLHGLAGRMPTTSMQLNTQKYRKPTKQGPRYKSKVLQGDLGTRARRHARK